MPSNNSDWLLFLSLERDFISTFDYVAIDPNLHGVYSIAYLKTLLSACSAIEQLGKEYCRFKGVALPDKPSIYKVRDGIKGKNQNFPNACCYIPRFSWLGELMPWKDDDWKVEGGPPWWQAYNDSKHNAYECSTQMSVIYCLAGLFCLNLAYYEKKANEFDLSAALFYDQPRLPDVMVVNVLPHQGAGSPIVEAKAQRQP